MAERTSIERVDRAVRALARGRRPLVLAVSGGLDSMVLLESVAAQLPGRVAAVATFDHGTGPAARAASRLAARRARELGLRVVGGRARSRATSEAGWRRARWSFLRHVARELGAVVVTAHTADDQVETVLLRALRGAGPRGLAGLLAPSAVRRPLLAVRRHDVAAYASALGVRWVEDPSNASLAHRRNRLRHELLPALRAVRAGVDDELLALGRRSARWRRDVEALAATLAEVDALGALHVAAASLAGYDRASLGVLWPALAGRAGVALDRRGTARLVGFTMSGDVGGRIQLAGGYEVARRREAFVLRPAAGRPAEECELPPAGAMRWGRWSFFSPRGAAGPDDPWGAFVPEGSRLSVRAWAPADRMCGPNGRPRRVKRFLRDAGVDGVDRAGWPVVVADGEIVWIPGVRRSLAATERSGRPGFSIYCELDDGRPAGR